jgi:AraC-like DNA-binding protein
LSKVRIRASQFGLVECTAPWSGRMPAGEELILFMILNGRCRLEVGEETPLWVSEGDVVFLPKGSAYRLGSSADAPDRWVYDMLKSRGTQCYTLQQDGGGEECVFLAALSAWDDVGKSTIATILPEIVLVRKGEFASESSINRLVELLRIEALAAREISPIIANDLINMILHEALYVRFSDDNLRHSLLSGFGNKAVAKALMFIHSAIVQDWTASSLAERVGMSRSAFTIEFTRLLGISPGQYLIEQKLNLAAQLLQESNLDVGLVADRVGYASMPSFIKAFKRHFGQSPGRYRREAREEASDFALAS